MVGLFARLQLLDQTRGRESGGGWSILSLGHNAFFLSRMRLLILKHDIFFFPHILRWFLSIFKGGAPIYLDISTYLLNIFTFAI